MEILNKGSFVPLDNRERMGQMIFTAKTFAAEIAKNAGFQYNDPTNQQLALEIWKGSEYMTRAHEEATIKNLFLSNFLKELDGVVKETKGVPVSALPQPIAAPPSVETSVSGNIEETVKTNSSDDEFLGVVSPDEPARSEVPRPSYADECKPECEDEIVEMINGSAKEMPGSQTENISIPETPPTTAAATMAASVASTIEPEPVNQTVAVVSTQPAHVEPIVLIEDEPFNFDSCTITAVIQLLPISDGFRKCVVSIRSHDFLPVINIDRLTAGRIRDEVKVSLEKALIKYRSELPALAAEKVKKDAQANKKAASKSSGCSKTKAASKTADASGKAAEPESEIDPNKQTGEEAKEQQTLFAQ
ncbi:MAG: hypothetical protein KF756_06165 [Acidobacteria bacterium]|nr:hypothetical protein [Acidobacteriota bacterium]